MPPLASGALAVTALLAQAILVPTLAPVTFVRAALPARIRFPGLVIIALANMALSIVLVTLITALPLPVTMPAAIVANLAAARLTRPLLVAIQARPTIMAVVRRLWRLDSIETPGAPAT